jgi:hypothetical protein
MCNSLSEATHRHQLQHSGHRMLYTLAELTPFGSEIRLLRLDAHFAFGWNVGVCHSEFVWLHSTGGKKSRFLKIVSDFLCHYTQFFDKSLFFGKGMFEGNWIV